MSSFGKDLVKNMAEAAPTPWGMCTRVHAWVSFTSAAAVIFGCKVRRKLSRICPLALCLLFFCFCRNANAFDFSVPFASWNKAISVEGAYAYFSPDRLGSGDAWNVGARFSLLPFGARHFDLLGGIIDGVLEIGLEPLFARFEGTHQNFGGVLLDLRYDLTGLSVGPFVPFIAASIGPGGSDLNIGRVSDETRLTGSFMATIRGEIGGLYFVNERAAVYLALQGEHFSNAGLNGANRNFALNTPWAGVFGISYYLH